MTIIQPQKNNQTKGYGSIKFLLKQVLRYIQEMRDKYILWSPYFASMLAYKYLSGFPACSPFFTT